MATLPGLVKDVDPPATDTQLSPITIPDGTVLFTTKQHNKIIDYLSGDVGTDFIPQAAIDSLVLDLSNKEDSLGFTPEDAANKGAISGYAGLDGSLELLLANFPSGAALQVLRRNAANEELEFVDPVDGGTSFISFTADANLNMGGFDINNFDNITGENSGVAIRDDGGNMQIDVAGNSTHQFRNGIVTKVTIFNNRMLLAAGVDLQITQGDELSFDTGVGDQTIIGDAGGLTYEVPINDTHDFIVNANTVGSFGAGGLNMGTFDITNLINITTNTGGTHIGNTNAQNAAFRDLGTALDPTNNDAGDFYYNTTSNVLRFYNGTVWGDIGGATSFIGFTADADLDMSTFDILFDTDGELRWGGSADRRIANTATGFIFEVEASDNYRLQINNATEYTFDSTTLDMNNNNLDMGSGQIQFVSSNTTIEKDGADNLQYSVATGLSHIFRIDNVAEYEFDATQADFLGNNLVGLGYQDFDRFLIAGTPADPAADIGRMYVRDVDANNDGLFIKIKQAGSIQEVQIV